MKVPCESCHTTFRLDSSLVKSTGTKVRCSKCRAVFKVYPPPVENRRKTPRVKTQNLISYFTYNENGSLISHGLGIALDISKGGILLETPYPMESGLLVLNATDRNKNSIEVKGKLVYSKATSTGTYLCGIEFMGVDERIRNFITKLIKEYHFQGNNLFIALKKRSHYLNKKTAYV